MNQKTKKEELVPVSRTYSVLKKTLEHLRSAYRTILAHVRRG